MYIMYILNVHILISGMVQHLQQKSVAAKTRKILKHLIF